MNWKEFLKHSFLLYAVILLFGLIFTIFETPIFLYNYKFQFWPKALIVSVIIPLIYAFVTKSRPIKELLIIAALFVIISSTVSYAALSGLKDFIIAKSDTAYFITSIFSSSPAPSLATSICAPTIPKFEKCTFTNNQITDFIFVYILTFSIIISSLFIGQFFSRNWKEFFKPSLTKIILLVVIIVIYFFIAFLMINLLQLPLRTADFVLVVLGGLPTIILNIVFGISDSLSRGFINLAALVIYFYTLSCLIVWIYSKIRKRK